MAPPNRLCLEAYISPDELADELVFQKTLLLTLDRTAEDYEQAETDIEAAIADIEAQLRTLRKNIPVTTITGKEISGQEIGASILDGKLYQQRSNIPEFISRFSNHNSISTDPFASDLELRHIMNSLDQPLDSVVGASATNSSSTNLNLPSRKRPFCELHGPNGVGAARGKSKRISPSPPPSTPTSYTTSSMISFHDDPVSRELELYNKRQKEIEEAAVKCKEDEAYARQLQDTYSTDVPSLSGSRASAPTGCSAYDRMMGRQNHSRPSKPQIHGSQVTNSKTEEISSSAWDSNPDQGPTSYQTVTPVLNNQTSYTPGLSLPWSTMPGSYPSQDSDSSVEIISTADFHDTKRENHLLKPPSSTNVGYGGYLSNTLHGPTHKADDHGSTKNYYPNIYNQTISGGYTGGATVSMNDPIAHILNQTSAIDYIAMQNRLNQGLAGEIYNYVSDPRKTEKEIQDLLENIRPDTEIPVEDREGTPEGLKYPLYEHQKLALTWLKSMEESSNKGGILADDMGLGKTISTLALLLSSPSLNNARKTTLIVGPVALIKQWEREILSKIVTGYRLSTFVYHSGKKATWSTLRTHDVVLTTYGTLAAEYKKFVDLEKRKKAHPGIDDSVYQSTLPFLGRNSKWYRVILDEAQCIKNKNTKAALATSLLKAETRFCLTGTPMMNGVHELYSLIHFLKIKPYNEYSRFSAEFSCLTKGTGPEHNMKRAMKKLQAVLKAILLRRTKQSRIDGRPILVLPKKTEVVSNAIFNEDEQAYYTSLEKKTRLQFNKYLKAGTIGKNYSNILVLLLRLRQAACHPHLIMDFEEAPTEATSEEMLILAKTLLPDVIGRIVAATIPFECPVCYDPVPNPSIVVPCGHDTCAQCLVKIASNFDQAIANGEDSVSAKCPTCRGAVDLRKIIDYETFRRAHMSVSKFLTSGVDGDSDSYGSDSDSGLEEADGNGNIKDFIVRDDYVSASESDVEDDDLGAMSRSDTALSSLGDYNINLGHREEVQGGARLKIEGNDKNKIEKCEGSDKDAVVRMISLSAGDDSDDEDLPADPFASFQHRLERGDKTNQLAGKSIPSRSQEAKPQEKSNKYRKSKKFTRRKKPATESEVMHASLAELKKKASKSVEGRRRYMRYLKKTGSPHRRLTNALTSYEVRLLM